MKEELITEIYEIHYIKEDNLILIQGNLRLESVEKYDEIICFITENVLSSENPITIDLTRLNTLNSSGIAALGMFLIEMKKYDRDITIIGSRYISWQSISLEGFKDINSRLSVEFIVHH